MKKTALALLFAVLSISAFSQKGDLTVGAKGGYVLSTADLQYNNILYGFDVAYHLSDPLEIAFTGLMNSNISHKISNPNYNSKEPISKSNQENLTENLAVYSANIDFRLYLIHQQSWGTGPALGGQYYIVDNKTANLGADKALGFNIGWHFRVNITDNLKLNAGWRYTNAKSKDKTHWWDSGSNYDISYHLLYLGLAYTFESK